MQKEIKDLSYDESNRHHFRRRIIMTPVRSQHHFQVIEKYLPVHSLVCDQDCFDEKWIFRPLKFEGLFVRGNFY